MSMRWISLVAFTVMAIVVWIFIGLTQDSTPESLGNTYREYLTPLSPKLDQEALDAIVTREGDTLLIDRDALE
jgi:hypothetical protein